MMSLPRFAWVVSFVLFVASVVDARAENRWAVIISGASGGDKYAEQMTTWRNDLRTTFVTRYQFKPEAVKVLVDETATTGDKSTADNVRKLFAEIKKTATKDDAIFVILLGHGTYDGDVAKFNLVGPDLTAKDWTDLLSGIPGHMTVVNTTEASFPFLESLTARGRVVITATDSAAQKYATVFPEYFVKAMKEASTDLDKNGRTSIYEVFQAASAAVKQHYEQRGQLTTERALLDDNGDKEGSPEPAPTAKDGRIAAALTLGSTEAADPLPADPALRARVLERRDLERRPLPRAGPDGDQQQHLLVQRRRAPVQNRQGARPPGGERLHRHHDLRVRGQPGGVGVRQRHGVALPAFRATVSAGVLPGSCAPPGHCSTCRRGTGYARDLPRSRCRCAPA